MCICIFCWWANMLVYWLDSCLISLPFLYTFHVPLLLIEMFYLKRTYVQFFFKYSRLELLFSKKVYFIIHNRQAITRTSLNVYSKIYNVSYSFIIRVGFPLIFWEIVLSVQFATKIDHRFIKYFTQNQFLNIKKYLALFYH